LVNAKTRPEQIPSELAHVQIVLGSNPPKDWLGYENLGYAAKTFDPDVAILMNDPTPCAVWSNRIRNAIGHNCEIVAYIPVDGRIVDSRGYGELERLGVRVVVYTRFGAQSVNATGKCKATWCYPGTDIEKWKPNPAARTILNAQEGKPLFSDDDFVVISTNRNAPRKMIPTLLESFGQLQKYYRPNAKLILRASRYDWGGDYVPYMEQLGLQGVITVDSEAHGGEGIPEWDMATLYQAADVFLSTSLTEGWGLCEAEAAASGCALLLPHDDGVRCELWGNAAEFIPTKSWIYAPAFCLTPGVLVSAGAAGSLLGVLANNEAERMRRKRASMDVVTARARAFTWKRLTEVLLGCTKGEET
jgi:glycosyltransferase involved in cell wall biosynthesis